MFDNFFQNKLRDHSSNVPEGLWSKIEEELRPEKEDRKRVFLFRRWYAAAAILVLALSATAWLYMNFVEKDSTLTDQSSVPAQVTPADKAPGNSPEATETAETTSKAGEQPNTTDTASSSVLGDTFAATGENNSRTSAAKTATGVARDKQPKGTATAVGSGAPGNSQATVGNPDSETAYGVPFRRRLNGGKKLRAAFSNAVNGNGTAATSGNDAINAGLPVSTNVLQTDAAHQTAFITLPSATSAIPALQKADYAALLRQYIQSQDNSFFPIIRCPPVRSAEPSDLFIEAYASPDKVFRHSSANNGATGYAAKRDTMLSLRTSFTAGVRLSKALTENLLVKAGLQYSQINENFRYRLENERKTITVVTTHTISNSPGDTVVVRDTTTYEQIGYIEKRIKNRYRSIDIPVLLSYEWGNSQWRFAVNAGPVINLRTWYSGEIPDSSSQISSVKGTSEVFRKNIGVGAYAGFSLIKTINENMDLFAEPWLRYNFSDMTRQGQAFNQKFTTTGLSLGIRYRLNGGQRY